MFLGGETMRAIGIVCEYNPFHTGHQYQIEQSKTLCGEDAAIVCVMSGDLVQRGEAALFPKSVRAEAAVRAGADIVFELPVPWCVSSADVFAAGAVELLAATGCGWLSFGCENNDEQLLKKAAALDMDEGTQEAIAALLRKKPTLSYARARQMVLEEKADIPEGLLASPNNILAISYLKALLCGGYHMTPIPVQRVGASHDGEEDGAFRSAMQLRQMMAAGEDVSAWIPEGAWRVYQKAMAEGNMSKRDNWDRILRARLIGMDAQSLVTVSDSEHGAGQRLYKTLAEGKDTEQTASDAATKRYTAARMRRLLLFAALGLPDAARMHPPYLRLLAMNEKGRRYLHTCGETAIPILTKPGDAASLGREAAEVFAAGAKVHDLFQLQFVTNDNKPWGADWRTGPVIV